MGALISTAALYRQFLADKAGLPGGNTRSTAAIFTFLSEEAVGVPSLG